jgi:glycosyltransferase involved in cell wall biosynthesis
MTGGTTEVAAPRVILCVPTFRRPDGLRKLLTHVACLNYGGEFEVIVVDNDADAQEGTAVVSEMRQTFRFPLSCVVEPRRGHTYAYNRAFALACRAASSSDYVAVLDDDEYPDPNWLREMIEAALRYGVDIVGGPVSPVFDQPDHWLAKSGLFAPVRFATGRVPMIYGAGNMLIRRTVLEQYLDEPFLNDFAFTGGSDFDFFWRCRIDGRSFAWADTAEVFETTPPARTTVGYLLCRKFRNGTEATRLERKFLNSVTSTARRWYTGLGLLGIGILSLPLAALRGRRAMMDSLIRAARGAGRIAAEFDLHYEQYR